jgi:site-specific DNA-adenine methylase
MDFNKMSKSELLFECKNRKIVKCSGKNKKQLIEMIQQVIPEITEEVTIEPEVVEAIEKKGSDIEIKNMDGLQYLSTISDGTIDLILTDPPYIISKETGMNLHYNTVKHNEENNIEFVKTQEDWDKYKVENEIEDDSKKNLDFEKYEKDKWRTYKVQVQKKDYKIKIKKNQHILFQSFMRMI